MSIFKGSGVAIVTPMDQDGNVNYAKLSELVEEQITGGTDAIIICGTTGESATLTEEEHTECIQTTVSAAKKRVPVIAGCGCNNTAHAVRLAQNARKAGADALLTVTPYYNKATQKGLKEYFKIVAGAGELPMILYNVPSRTGCNILPQTAAELAREVENIVAIKDAAGNISQTMKTAQLCGSDLDIYSGNDDQIIPILSAGGIGVISVLANVAPKQTHDMVMEYLNGDRKKALAMQLEAIPLIEALFCEVNPIPVKTALNLMGKAVGGFRSPMCEMDDKNVDVLKKALKEYGLL
ncbi:4-hydroxy-tetrahydrodipicolinate synthase [Lachnospiraceae bacterium XBB1006]|nr:4-hydroxy-tetrahydrodipicolinate synthase [Lachnospiraceae bacterium XBB1006]